MKKETKKCNEIKKYYLTDNKIVIKYVDNKIKQQNLNCTNLKKLMNQLDKQYNFDINMVDNDKDLSYTIITYVTFIACLIEGIIFLNLLISFEVGHMKQFMISSILSGLCIISYFIYLLISLIKLQKINKKYKICVGKEILNDKYSFLKAKNPRKKRTVKA